MPATAGLGGLLTLVLYVMSHATVTIPGTIWEESVIIGMKIEMSTGSGKTQLYKY